ncbi:MAG TPA: HAD family hydrolase [Candidatus Izemoplasmatales bacterium]|nr:HAD family hydrolase [Bacillota bacterium]HRY77188.1 HAD family hydrolase [Candidatus Izemoplasmatales bacterium]
MLDTILFDLDGTLLPLDEPTFLRVYFGGLIRRFAPKGLHPDDLIRAIGAGIDRVRENIGPETNEKVFWKAFMSVLPQAEAWMDEFYRYYEEDFDQVRISSQVQPLAATIIGALHRKGYRTVLATNPLFPRIATEKRIRWAGLSPSDFELITTMENSTAAKPSQEYYLEVLRKCGSRPENCMMVGNDVWEDGAAESLGIPFYLVTDCIINDHHRPWESLRYGTFIELARYLDSLPPVGAEKRHVIK